MAQNSVLIGNIKRLYQTRTSTGSIKGSDMATLPFLENAYLLIQDGIIKDFGLMQNCPELNLESIDATDKFVLPSWCDSHTHLVYAGSRESEFIDKIKGLSYEEIAKNGGGILNSAQRLRNTTEEVLFEQASERLKEIISFGTGAVEIKSGYGLSTESELKMLRVIRSLKAISPVTIKSTFLAAHALPLEYKDNRSAYIDLIVNEMLPIVADEELADYCDVFCDRGFFTPEETDRILIAGNNLGIKPKIHANELDYSGGIQIGVKNNAISVDHLECVGVQEIDCLLNSNTMPTLLPSTAFFLKLEYPPARKMIDSGLPVALASDYNPGSSPSGKMSFVLSLACIYMKMLPEEAINAATINGAVAMELQDSHGQIKKGYTGNVIISKKMPEIAYIPYSFGSDLIDKVILKGVVQ